MYLYIFHLMCYNIYNYDFEDEYEKSFIADCSICFNILACFLWENETGRQRKTEYNCNAFSAIR